MILKNRFSFSLKQTPTDCFPKVVRAWRPLGSGGICHCSSANSDSGWSRDTGCVLANRPRLPPPASLSGYFAHFLSGPSSIHTSQGAPLPREEGRLAWRSEVTVYNEFSCPHIEQCAFLRKSLTSD